MPKNLYESIKIYEKTVEESLEPRGPPLYVASDMIALVLGGPLRDTKKQRRLLRLVDGKKYGFLTLRKKEKDTQAGKTRYKCECECGESVMLPRKEIQARVRMRAGCLGFECPFGPAEVKAWHNQRFALWLQLTSLLKSQPEEVDNVWGGRAYDGVELVKVEDGFSTFLRDVTPLLGRRRGEWWLRRKNPVLPYSLFNVEFVGEPDFHVLGNKSRYVSYNGVLFSVNELASLYGLPLNDVKRWRREYISDNKLMRIIMAEAANERDTNSGTG